MTIGISKRILEAKFSTYYWSSDSYEDLLNLLVSECTELDPWLPIDDNTPKDRDLILKSYATNKVWIGIINHNCLAIEAPTHYKELPPDRGARDQKNAPRIV